MMTIVHQLTTNDGEQVARVEADESGRVFVSLSTILTPDEADCVASLLERAAEDARVLKKETKPL